MTVLEVLSHSLLNNSTIQLIFSVKLERLFSIYLITFKRRYEGPILLLGAAIVITITCNSNHGLRQCKDISMKISTPGSFGPDHGV